MNDELPLRYLPRDGEAQTPIALTCGHAVQVKAQGVDGKAGTLLHPRFVAAALSAGCRPIKEAPETPQGKPRRADKVPAAASPNNAQSSAAVTP